MIDTQLILVDGMSGSGKTTTAQWLYLTLHRAGAAAAWITEGQRDHPIFDREVAGSQTCEDAISRAAGHWRRFSADAAAAPGVTVMDGAMLDSPISFLLLQDTPAAQIERAVCEFAAATRALRPFFVHLVQPDVDAALEFTSTKRGELWRQHLISYVSSSAFARSRGLSGMDAAGAYYREARRIADLAFERLGILKIAVDTSTRDWAAHRSRILDALEPPEPAPAPTDDLSDLKCLTGEYRDTVNGRTWRVLSDAGTLYLEGEGRMKLLRLEGRRFLLEGWPVELTFEGTAGARADRVHYLSKMDDGLQSELTWERI